MVPIGNKLEVVETLPYLPLVDRSDHGPKRRKDKAYTMVVACIVIDEMHIGPDVFTKGFAFSCDVAMVVLMVARDPPCGLEVIGHIAEKILMLIHLNEGYNIPG